MQNTPSNTNQLEQAIEDLGTEVALNVILKHLDQESAKEFLQLLENQKFNEAMTLINTKIANLGELFDRAYASHIQQIDQRLKDKI